MSLKYKKKLIPLAKMMRKNMTRHEKHLWYDFLNKYPTRFQRQKTIDGYIADFYCHKAKLVVELDGTQHYENKAIEYDTERTETFESNTRLSYPTNVDVTDASISSYTVASAPM